MTLLGINKSFIVGDKFSRLVILLGRIDKLFLVRLGILELFRGHLDMIAKSSLGTSIVVGNNTLYTVKLLFGGH